MFKALRVSAQRGPLAWVDKTLGQACVAAPGPEADGIPPAQFVHEHALADYVELRVPAAHAPTRQCHGLALAHSLGAALRCLQHSPEGIGAVALAASEIQPQHHLTGIASG